MLYRCPVAIVLSLATIGAASSASLGGGPDGRSPLGGPSVTGDSDRDDTLIRRGYDGLIAPLDAPPAIAALRLLDLNDEANARVQAVLTERWALLDGLVRKHALLLSEVEPVLTAGSPREKFLVIQRSLVALEPLRAWGKLHHRIAEALPAEARSRYESLVTEYERAMFEQLMATGEADSGIAVRMNRYWTDLGWEIERSAERVFREEDGDDFNKLIEKLKLTPEQEATVRAEAEALYLRTGGLPSEADEQTLFFKILGELSWGQRLELLGMAARGELEPDDSMNP